MSLLRKQIPSCRDLWCIRRVLGMFPLTQCFSLGLDQRRCNSCRWVMPLMSCRSKSCGRNLQGQTDRQPLTYCNISSIQVKRKRNLQGQSPHICIWAALFMSRACVGEWRETAPPWAQSQERAPMKVTLFGHCYCSSASPCFNISPWSILGHTHKALTTPRPKRKSKHFSPLSSVLRTLSLPPYSLLGVLRLWATLEIRFPKCMKLAL